MRLLHRLRDRSMHRLQGCYALAECVLLLYLLETLHHLQPLKLTVRKTQQNKAKNKRGEPLIQPTTKTIALVEW